MVFINNFSEDELSLILYILNLNDPTTEITLAHLKAFKSQALAQKLSEVKDKLNDEGLIIYNSIIGKLGR